MSTEPHDLSLGEYIVELVRRLSEGDPEAGLRLAATVRPYRASIALDDERVVLSWGAQGLVLESDEAASPPDGYGRADRLCVLALLGGELSLADALLDGWLEVHGHRDAILAMLSAIEILLQCSTRLPALRELEATFRSLAQARADTPARERKWQRATPLGPSELRDEERELLSRLDLAVTPRNSH
jgi:hypothetical protein